MSVFFGSRCCLIDISGNLTLFKYRFMSCFQLFKDLCLLVKSIGKFCNELLHPEVTIDFYAVNQTVSDEGSMQI